MTRISYDDWKESTTAIPEFKQSDALKAVTDAFRVYGQRKTKANLDRLSQVLQVWSTTGPIGERTTLATARNDLGETIQADENSDVVINVRASNVGQSRLYELLPAPADAWLDPRYAAGDPMYVPALTPSQVQQLNEGFRRANRAATLARDEVIKIAARSAIGNSDVEREYIECFGAFDRPRAQKVLANYKCVVDSLDLKVKLFDIRNATPGVANFAMCNYNKVTRDADNKVTSRVEMFLCRGFFTAYDAANLGKYEGTTASTVWTLVHELAHGTFYAVDAPRVLPDGTTWELQPDRSMQPDQDGYGASPVNAQQSSGKELDLRLAVKDPDIAIRNADSYGLFAHECLVRAEKS